MKGLDVGELKRMTRVPRPMEEKPHTFFVTISDHDRHLKINV
jgi:hypothetical protein